MNARLCGRRFWFRLLFFGLLCFVVTPLSAEVLFMRDGSRISGRIVSQTRDEIIIRTDSGTRRVEKRNVTRVVYNSDVARLLENDPNAFVDPRANEAIDAGALRDYLAVGEARLSDLAAAVVGSPERREPSPESLRLAALMRSAVFPGWGQIYQGRTKRGVVVAGGFAALAGGTAYLVSAYNSRYTLYEAAAARSLTAYALAGTPALLLLPEVDGARARADRAAGLIDYGAGALAAFWLWNLFDVYLYETPGGDSLTLQGFGNRMVMSWESRF